MSNEETTNQNEESAKPKDAICIWKRFGCYIRYWEGWKLNTTFVLFRLASLLSAIVYFFTYGRYNLSTLEIITAKIYLGFACVKEDPEYKYSNKMALAELKSLYMAPIKKYNKWYCYLTINKIKKTTKIKWYPVVYPIVAFIDNFITIITFGLFTTQFANPILYYNLRYDYR